MHRCLVLIFFIGCSTYTVTTESMHEAIDQGDVTKALENLESFGFQDHKTNRLLYLMEKGSLLDQAQKGRQARASWMEAQALSQELYTQSAAKTALTLIANDSVQNYEGEDYEKVALHTLTALSFIEDEKIEASQVEVRRVNQTLYELTQKYPLDFKGYHEDAFAMYLSGLVWEAEGQLDDALISYQKALASYEGSFKEFYQGGISLDLIRAILEISRQTKRYDVLDHVCGRYDQLCLRLGIRSPSKSLDEGVVTFLVETGRVARKKAKDFFIHYRSERGQSLRFSFPAIEPQPKSLTPQLDVKVGFDVMKTFDHVIDYSRIAKRVLDDKRGRMILKGSARVLARAAMTDEVYRRFGPFAGALANVVSVVTEVADTRSWTMLPHHIFVARVRRREGWYPIKIYKNDRLVWQKSLLFTKGKMQIIRVKLSG